MSFEQDYLRVVLLRQRGGSGPGVGHVAHPRHPLLPLPAPALAPLVVLAHSTLILKQIPLGKNSTISSLSVESLVAILLLLKVSLN